MAARRRHRRPGGPATLVRMPSLRSAGGRRRGPAGLDRPGAREVDVASEHGPSGSGAGRPGRARSPAPPSWRGSRAAGSRDRSANVTRPACSTSQPSQDAGEHGHNALSARAGHEVPDGPRSGQRTGTMSRGPAPRPGGPTRVMRPAQRVRRRAPRPFRPGPVRPARPHSPKERPRLLPSAQPGAAAPSGCTRRRSPDVQLDHRQTHGPSSASRHPGARRPVDICESATATFNDRHRPTTSPGTGDQPRAVTWCCPDLGLSDGCCREFTMGVAPAPDPGGRPIVPA